MNYKGDDIKPNWVSEDVLAELDLEIIAKDKMILSLLKKLKDIENLVRGKSNIIFKEDIEKILNT